MPYKKAITHLKKDSILKNVIEINSNEVKPSLEFDLYHFLLESIVSQQLSVKVADIIFARFIDLFVNRYPTAKTLIGMDDEILRNVGLSYRKASYLKNVAEFSLKKSMDFEYLQQKTDDEIIEYLTEIKGVGKWTVQMILMFPMDRPNVFPVDDLGIQTNMKAIYGLVSDKKIPNSLTKKELKSALEKIAEQWQPHRTLASKFIWNWSQT
jgi:DNA-3-methyladenine glycosylase II